MGEFGEIREILEALDVMVDIEIELSPEFSELNKTTKRIKKADPLTLAKTIASFSLVGSVAGMTADDLKAARDAYVDQWKAAVIPSASKNASATTTP